MADQVIQVLDNLCQKFGIVVDWTSENILPYIENLIDRYIIYEIVTSVAWIMFPISFIIISLLLIKEGKKMIEKDEHDNDDDCDVVPGEVVLIIGIILLGVSVLFGSIIIIDQIGDIITCLTIPEKIIINELKILLK